MTDYTGKDGLERDILKSTEEFKTKWWPAMKMALKRFGRALTGNFRDLGHAYISLWKDGRDASSYFSAKLSGLVTFPAFLILLGCVIFL